MAVDNRHQHAKEAMVQTSEVAVEDWQAKVSKKQKSAHEKIPKEWLLPETITSALQYPLEQHANRLLELDIPKRSGILSDQELSITEDYTVAALLKALAESKLSSLEVTLAFSKRAAIAGQLTNSLTETYFDQAQERAKQLDDLKANGKSAGPLHGLPISLKDGFFISGSEATTGLVSLLGIIADKNAALVDLLLEQGAVLYVKTNIPMTLMTADSHNNIFGRTLNPHNTLLTAGGSSGGEGALVAFRGSPLGVGTDIAGSIRIPSLCDGTYGFKPSSCRIPQAGQAVISPPGASHLFYAVAGPLANDLEALHIFSKAVIDARPARFDSVALDVPWRDVTQSSKKSLKLGVLAEDSLYPLHPPVKRALKEAIRLLQAQGHEIVQLKPEECLVAEATEVAFALFGVKAFGPDMVAKGGEPAVPSVVMARSLGGDEMLKFTADAKHLVGIERMAALTTKRLAIGEAWRELWNKYQMDAVISPPAQHTAVPHDQYLLPPYTVFLNTLDYPACVIPFMKSSADLDPEPFKVPAGQRGPEYNPETMSDLPCSIQVFTPRMRDEECLQVAVVVDQCLNPK